MTSVRLVLTFFVAVCLARAAIAQEQATKVIWDFEQQGLGSQWSAIGKLSAAREPHEVAEQPRAAKKDDLLPGGQVVKLDAQAGSYFATKKELPRVAWERAERVSFWVFRSAGEAKRDADCTFDLQFFDGANRALFARKLVVKGSGWQQVEVPCEWIAPVNGRVGNWPAVNRLGFGFREESHLSVDGLQVDLNVKPRPALPLAAVVPIAFPKATEKEIKTAEREGFLVATNAAECKPDVVADLLVPVVEKMNKDLPLLPATSPARLLIFATREEYEQFPPRLAQQFGKEAAIPKSNGFTILGWATAGWDPQQGEKRPVFVHEFVHSLIESRLQLANEQEWLQEGLATYYQLQIYPQKNVPEIVQAGLARGDFDMRKLTSGQPIATTDYWQAATLCSLLLRDPGYQPQLKELITALQQADSTKLEPHLATVFKTDFNKLTADWKKHCREAFPVK
ncbi:hypothetical protein NA78x_005893 [Anatilimnocola sp. NA78]|uniref:hypothetical protein n=1 Tax=Anatilimnocola sp. NA78 TaxID=3415683 RepID=UPI003CE5A422